MTSNKSKRQKAYAELSFSDYEPAEVTRRLGIQSDEAHRKGDPTSYGTVWKTHHWCIEECELNIPLDADYAAIVEQCLDRLMRRISDESLLSRLAELSRDVAPAIGVYGYCREVPNLYYSSDVIRTAARIGASIDEDFYAIYGPVNESSEE